MLRLIYSTIATLAIVWLAGCGGISSTVKPMPKSDGWPATTKSAVHAGIYYSPEFFNQERMRASGENTFTVPIGAASVRLFDDLYARVFEKTSQISKLPMDKATAQGVDVVIAPSLEHFDFRVGLNTDSDRYSISYRNTLYTNQGVPVASWIVSGNAKSKTMGSPASWIEDDMNDAAAKFLQTFRGEAGPALAAIASNQGRQAVPLDVRDVGLTTGRAELPGLDPKLVAALQEAGVVTLSVTAQSQASSGLVVRASDMRLRLKNGEVIAPSSVSSILSVLERKSKTGGVVAGLVGAPFGVLTTIAEDRSKQAERELQYRSAGQSVFGDRTLSKGKNETGIVLFRLPEGPKSAEVVALTAWVVEPSSARGAQIEAPFPNSVAKSGEVNVDERATIAPVSGGADCAIAPSLSHRGNVRRACGNTLHCTIDRVRPIPEGRGQMEVQI